MLETVPNIPTTQQIRALQRLLLRAVRRRSLADAAVGDIRATLQGICDHPDPVAYHWEHDNGFGRQTPQIGARCTYCGWIDRWKLGRFVDPKELD